MVLVVKNLPANAGEARDMGSTLGSRKIPWKRKWQPTPVFLPGESHGQRSLAGYRPWGCKEWDAAEHAHTQFVSSNPRLLIYPALLSPLVTMFVFYVWEEKKKKSLEEADYQEDLKEWISQADESQRRPQMRMEVDPPPGSGRRKHLHNWGGCGVTPKAWEASWQIQTTDMK